jgi:LPS-assembly protein
MKYLKLFLFVICLAVSFVSPNSSMATAETAIDNKVDLTSNTLHYDDTQKIAIAEGAVEIIQAGRILKSDRVDYYIDQDRVVATGNVTITEPSGDIYYADRLELTNQMKDGTVQKFRTLLQDGARFTAQSGERINGEKIIMNTASYSPCDLCKYDPTKPPLWQIKANKVIHNTTEKSITYNDATFELGGVPIVYTPYFSHPDGTENQKAGFIAPTFSLSSDLGFGVTSQYYIPINRSEDITIGAQFFTEQKPLLLGEHRKRFNRGEIKTNASMTHASRSDSVGGQDVGADGEFRGHLFSQGVYDINQKWRAGYGVQLTSDDQYLNQYDISSEDILENELYLERFDNRNYASARLIGFQDVRVSNRAADQPNV